MYVVEAPLLVPRGTIPSDPLAWAGFSVYGQGRALCCVCCGTWELRSRGGCWFVYGGLFVFVLELDCFGPDSSQRWMDEVVTGALECCQCSVALGLWLLARSDLGAIIASHA